MKRLGSVVVFKKGITKAQAEAALKSLATVLDENYQYPKGLPRVHEYDDAYGGPVFYIP